MATNRSGTQWLVLSLLVMALGLGVAAPSWANAPLGGQHYPNGAEDFVSGALPPPGVYLKTYFAQFQKDRLKGSVPGSPFAGVGDDKQTPVEFQADVSVVVPRFIWVTPLTLGGASVATQLFLPMYWADVQSSLGIDDQADGLGDILFTPLALGWHFGPNFHLILAEDLFIPIGNYDSENAATQVLNKNHWTFETVLAATYLVKGWDFSAKFMYDFNTTNDDYTYAGALEGDLEPGQEFHIDWGVGYSPKPGLRYGISGYSYWQMSEDEFKGSGGAPDFTFGKGKVHAVGPTIKYWPNQGRFSATLKYQYEFGAENLPEGQTSWLNIVWVF